MGIGKAFVEMHPKIQKRAERYITKQKWDDGDGRVRHLLRGGRGVKGLRVYRRVRPPLFATREVLITDTHTHK